MSAFEKVRDPRARSLTTTMHTTTTTTHRARWAAIGAAVAVSVGAGGLGLAQAGNDSGEKAIFQPISPCRMADTRSGEFNVGDKSTPLGAAEVWTLSAASATGNCPAFAGASALELNVTALDATDPTFITLFPAGEALPTASNLNPVPGQPPTPNSVTVTLNDSGAFTAYNAFGSVNVVIDVVGYYEDHNHDDRYYTEVEVDALLTDVSGEQGPAGPAGKDGKDGADGFSAWDEIPSGVTVRGVASYDASTTGSSDSDRVTVNLPGIASHDLNALTNVKFKPGPDVLGGDPACTGSTVNPTAPPGMVCVYLDSRLNATDFTINNGALPRQSFDIRFEPETLLAGQDYRFTAEWAYTAP